MNHPASTIANALCARQIIKNCILLIRCWKPTEKPAISKYSTEIAFIHSDPLYDSYSNIINHLCEDIEPAIPIPETITVRDGKPLSFISYNKKNKIITKITKERQLKHQLLMKYIIKQASLKRGKQNLSSNSTTYAQSFLKEKSSSDCLRDIVGVRFNDESYMITNETEFIKLMTGTKGSSKWKEIDYIQILTTILLPNERYFYYEFNVFEYTIDSKCPLNYSSIYAAVNLSSYDEFQKLCISLAFKIVEIYAKITCREIIYMKCDFTKDYFGFVWVNYLYDIKSTPIKIDSEEIAIAKKVHQ